MSGDRDGLFRRVRGGSTAAPTARQKLQTAVIYLPLGAFSEQDVSV
jgi:hypothetical protein